MKTIKETKLNTISSLTNTHMTKLLPQELSIYSKKEYQKCPHITKCSKSYGFVYVTLPNVKLELHKIYIKDCNKLIDN